MRSIDAPASPARPPDYNLTGVDYRAPIPRPKVRGMVIDYHLHLLAARQADVFFEAAHHYGIDACITMSQLEEAVALQRGWGHKLQFIAVPKWQDHSVHWADDWRRRIDGFYNLGSRIVKFHMAPGTMAARKWRLDSPEIRRIMGEARDRKMALMSHVGDPDTWYTTRYTDQSKFGTREEHYQMWESALAEFAGVPWIGAHMGGNPEDLLRLQRLLDTYPNLLLDCSATRWMVREISKRREEARDFFIRNEDRLLFGSDQVTGDERGFDFLASRFWAHRKLWETAYVGRTNMLDPDVPGDRQPFIRGLALPDSTLQKLYHDNTVRLLKQLGMTFLGRDWD